MKPVWTMLILICGMRAADGTAFQKPATRGSTACEAMHEVNVYTPVEAAISHRSLTAALDEARWILRSLCVDVEWVESEAPHALLVRILQKPLTDATTEALGFAMPSIGRGNRGAVFLDRVQATVEASAGRIDVPTLLACVIAHEIGHLLLRSSAHASEGIMRPHLGKAEIAKASQRRLTFTVADRLRYNGRGSHPTVGASSVLELGPAAGAVAEGEIAFGWQRELGQKADAVDRFPAVRFLRWGGTRPKQWCGLACALSY